ncbi:V-type ATP synthase subunit F [Candidatus Omnitrophota bacterium]
MYSITAIVPKGQGHGFSLAGIQVREVTGINDAHEALSNAFEDKHNGLILIDEAYNTDMPAKLKKMVDESTIPLVVSIPVITKWEQIHDHDDIINNIIRHAVGYRIKLGDAK